MAEVKQYNNFNGGMAEGSKNGYPSSFQNGIGIDYKTDSDRATSLFRLKLDYSPTDQIKDIREYKGKKFFYGDTGEIYQKDLSNSYSVIKTVPNSNGQGFEIFNDSLFYANQSTFGKATNLANSTPTFTDSYFNSYNAEYDQTFNGSVSSTYTTPTSIIENATNLRTFIPTRANITGVAILIATRGTGDITITVHDVSNNLIFSKTSTNASLPASGFIRIMFGSLIPLVIGNTYHFHVTSTVADANVQCTTLNDLSTLFGAELAYYNNLDVDQKNDLSNQVSAGISYTLPLLISEAPINRQNFVPLYSSLSAISLMVSSLSAATWTVTVHDSNNNLIGSASLAPSSITGQAGRGWYFRINFATPLKLLIGGNYHFHLTVSSGSGDSVVCYTGGDLSTCAFFEHFSVLNTDINFHQMKVFGNKLCIGNGRYLSTLDDSEVYNPIAVAFPFDETVRALETIGDYLAISTWKGNNLTSYGHGRIYFWDGVSPFYSIFIDIDGQVNAMKNDGNNILFVWHGTQGNLSVYTGAITKLRRIKSVKTGVITTFNPKAVDNWEGILLFGNGGSSSNVFDSLVYSYGRKDKDYQLTLNKDYVISTGNRNQNVTISALIGISSTELYVCWKDTNSGTNYGIDIIDLSQQQLSAYLYTLREDNGDSHREKVAKTASLRFDPIQTNQKFRIAYRINNANTNTDITGFTVLGSVDPVNNPKDFVGQVIKTFPLPSNGVRYLEIEWLVEIDTQIGTTAPNLISLGCEFERESEFQLNYI